MGRNEIWQTFDLRLSLDYKRQLWFRWFAQNLAFTYQNTIDMGSYFTHSKKFVTKRAPITTSMDGLKNQLGSMIGEQSAAPLIIEFHKFFKTLPFKDQRWFNKCFARKKSSQHPDLYRRMRLAWLTRRETIHPSIKRSDKMSPFSTFCACKGSLG